GLVLSPSYAEDNLMYAYVTTAEDNRVLRLAPGAEPTPTLTGIPKGADRNGGVLAVVGDLLFVATGDAGDPEAAADPTSLAGKVLRVDTFGNPHGGTLDPGSPVYSVGLTDPTGGCLLPTGDWAVLDHRASQDVLLPPHPGR